MKNNKVIYFLLFFLVMATSCKNNANKSEADAIDEVVLEEAKVMIASIPAPNSLVVMNLLSEAGAGYIYDITNKTEYINNYLTARQKALALGVYSADLSYVTSYNQQEESSAYIVTFKKLIEDLEIPIKNPEVITRFQNNLDKKDTLIKIVNEVFMESNVYLNSSDRVDIALYMLIGSWIETVYLLEKTIEFSVNKAPLVKIVLSNKQTLDKMIYMLDDKKNDEGFVELYDTLNHIRELFIKVGADQENEELVDELKAVIKEARSNII